MVEFMAHLIYLYFVILCSSFSNRIVKCLINAPLLLIINAVVIKAVSGSERFSLCVQLVYSRFRGKC